MSNESKADDEAAKAVSDGEETEGAAPHQPVAGPSELASDSVRGTSQRNAAAPHEEGAPGQTKPQCDAAGKTSGATAEAESAAPPPEAQASTRSPVEAFAELSAAVHALRDEMDEVGSFVRLCKDKLLRQADEYRWEGMQAVVESLMRLHELIYRQVTAMEGGNVRPDEFMINLFQVLEAELGTHGVEVVTPHPGDSVNFDVMTTIGTVSCPFWRKPDRVAQVSRCGFVLRTQADHRVLRKAEVTVYRR